MTKIFNNPLFHSIKTGEFSPNLQRIQRFYIDRKAQYTVFAFRRLLDSLDVVQFFLKGAFLLTRLAVIFKCLKKEETNRKTYDSLQELQLSVFKYIDGFYNSRRSHGSLAMLTPNQAKLLY